MSHQRKLEEARKRLRTCRHNEDEAYAEWTQTGHHSHRMAYVEATEATFDAENEVEEILAAFGESDPQTNESEVTP